MTTYVLAHLSDPHLGPLPRPRLIELAGKRAIGYLNWWRKRGRIHQGAILRRIVGDLKAQVYDHIAVTGDLVNISLPGEYAPALAWLESLGPPQDVTLVPGNHDAYVWAAARYPQSQWGGYLRGDNTGCAEAANGPVFPFLRRRGPLALIGLSSAVPTAPLMASGELGGDQIARCAELLDRCRGEDLFRVVLIHHPPVSRRKHHLRRLVDSRAFCEMLARHGAELVLHGHAHTHLVSYLDGPQHRVPVVGVPSASELPPGEHDAAAYNLYRIGRHAGNWRCEVISRGLSRKPGDGQGVTELRRFVLTES
ncbi:MAG: metallophosphoesterase [Xanthobacteraceae bacterium]